MDGLEDFDLPLLFGEAAGDAIFSTVSDALLVPTLSSSLFSFFLLTDDSLVGRLLSPTCSEVEESFFAEALLLLLLDRLDDEADLLGCLRRQANFLSLFFDKQYESDHDVRYFRVFTSHILRLKHK